VQDSGWLGHRATTVRVGCDGASSTTGPAGCPLEEPALGPPIV
jgi:hypothetical protein